MVKKAFVARLQSLSVIRIEGADAAQFLQGQTTQNVLALEDGAVTLIGLCSPKGRLLASGHLWREGETYCLAIDRAIAPAIGKRLRMYVLRSKVTLGIDTRALYGIVGDPEELRNVFARILPLSCASAATRVAAALPAGRALALEPITAIEENGSDALFAYAGIAAGEAIVREATAGAFVPQAVNLEAAGGVSFSKGCYTGQEVVSRVQFIGKTPRRMGLFAATAPLCAKPGDQIAQTDDRGQATVVDCAMVADRSLVLLECPVGQTSRQDWTVGDITLHPLTLPYALEAKK